MCSLIMVQRAQELLLAGDERPQAGREMQRVLMGCLALISTGTLPGARQRVLAG